MRQFFSADRTRIDREGHRGARKSLLAVSRFLAGLNDHVLRLFPTRGGRPAMIEPSDAMLAERLTSA
jgi:hypothetical protein